MAGINSRPLPANGQLQQRPNGHYLLQSAGGHTYALDGEGRIRAFSRGDRAVGFDRNGQWQTIRAPSMTVRRLVGGGQLVESTGPDGSRIVSSSPDVGHIDRRVNAGGQWLVQRTAIAGSSVSVSYYRTVNYNGVVLQSYLPQTAYAPGFYLWLLTPWKAPVVYQPNLVPTAAESPYGDYFQPQPSYTSPIMWMTDQVIAGELPAKPIAQAPIPQSQRDLDSTAPGHPETPLSEVPTLPRVSATQTTPITPTIKVDVGQQFGKVLTADSALQKAGPQASAPVLPAVLDPAIRYYFVDGTLNVRTARGTEYCSLNQGEALHINAPPPANATEAELTVATSYKGDCPSGSHVLVSVGDLQAMNNHIHESLSAAATKLGTQGGQAGLPNSPPPGFHPVVPGLQDAAASSNEAKGATAEIAAQREQALALEADMQAEAQAGLPP